MNHSNHPLKLLQNVTEDKILGEWVYCAQHLRPHQSGWCTVGLEDKVGLGPFTGTHEDQLSKATEKCRHLGLNVKASIAGWL